VAIQTPRESRCLVIAGTHSGVGKTTVALALMAALRRRGLCVQPFKVGPDFIDPGHHTAICGRVSRNLDTWMLSEETVRGIFVRASTGADISVIEGVMGLFDGRSADDARGSTAHLAQLLGAPVLLVVDAEAVAGSIAATVKGFAEFDPAVRVSAVLCNRVAGPRHYAHLEPAIRRHTRVFPVGWLPRRPEWHIPERHLGLVTQQDLGGESGAIDVDRLGAALEETVDIDALLHNSIVGRRACGAGSPAGQVLPAGKDAGPTGGGTHFRVAVARDAAFCFYYQDNLDLLQAAGAEIVNCSPVHDAVLPDGIDLVYLGGGYPELHAARLAANRSMLDSLRAYHRRGGAIYAECGGLMLCCRELVDAEGRVFPLLDLLPARTVMQKRLAALGYVTWRATTDSLLGPAGTELRGHEFHYSRLEALGALQPAAVLQRAGEEPRPDGFVHGRLLAGYAHLHFASQPQAVEALLGRRASDQQSRAAWDYPGGKEAR
jgi:cobyrinic acid a,c-diamide synthase